MARPMVRTVRMASLAMAILILPTAGWAGGFNGEVLLSGGSAEATGSPRMNVDFIDHIFVTWIEDGEVHAVSGIDLSGGGYPVTSAGIPHADPGVYRSSNPTATIVFQRDIGVGVNDLEIFYVTNVGGAFGTPIDLSQSSFEDRRPFLAGSPTGGDRNVVWERLDGGQYPSVYFSRDLTSVGEFVAEGEFPIIAVSPPGETHLIYARDFDIYYRLDQENGFGSEVLVSVNPTLDQEAAIAVDSQSIPYVVFSDGADIRLRRGDGLGGFEALENLSTSMLASRQPQIAVRDGVVAVVYREGTDVFLTVDSGSDFSPPENITQTPGTEQNPQVRISSQGHVHVVYQRGGEVYYRNNAPPPSPAFSADLQIGEQPLTVQFTNESTGQIASYLWEFGDGNTSSQQNPTHTYEITGTYDVTLTTVGPGGTFSLTEPNFITVTNPSNVMRIPPVIAFQGQPGVHIPVLGTHPDAIQGCQISLTWDPTVIDLVDITLESTEFDPINPEFFAPNIETSTDPVYFTAGIIIDTLPPFDGRTLMAGTDQRLLNLIVDVPTTSPAPSTTLIDLQHGFSDPPIFNIFIVDGSSVVPVLEDGELEIVPLVFPPPTFFIRGDANISGGVNLADCILLLNYLFSMGVEPACFDAADVDDSGDISLVDAIAALTFIFSGAGVPPVPYPNPGLDPTPDSLPDC